MKFVSKYHFEDYIGKQINNLKAVDTSELRTKDGSKQWIFECICGKEIYAPPARVISGHIKSCGCTRYIQPHNPRLKGKTNPKKIDFSNLIGQTNNKLTVVAVHRSADGGRAKLECLCSCGRTAFVYPYQFKSGDIMSCGCARTGNPEVQLGNTYRKTHGLTKNRFYKKWNDMVRRCHNPNEPAYQKYGAKGITVCDEWRYSPDKFIEWCESTHPSGDLLTIDRIDGTKGYSPSNCRWSTQSEQMFNIKTNHWITVNDETHCVSEWARLLKVRTSSIHYWAKKLGSFENSIQHLIVSKGYSAPVE